MSRAVRYVEKQLLSDRHFLYTAFAPMSVVGLDKVLVKVGISTVPMNRLVAVHCNCPFPLEYAAFTPVGGQKRAKQIEGRILASFKGTGPRGEWLALGVTDEEKTAFAARVNRIIVAATQQPVTWARVSKAELLREVGKSARQGA